MDPIPLAADAWTAKDYVQLVMPIIAGAISGGAVSLLGPYVSWRIEKQRELRKSQAVLLASVREILKEPPDGNEFARHPLYFQIKSFLQPSTINEIEQPRDISQLLSIGHISVPTNTRTSC